MDSDTQVLPQDVEALQRFSACTLANAIELLNLRPRTEGYSRDPLITCRFPQIPPVAGFAVTGRMRSASQPIHGHCYYDHEEWWRYAASVPAPRIIAMVDADDPPGVGALFGGLHARICMALGCVAYISNGAVRDLDEIQGLGFQLFSGSASVSHAYAHVVDFGGEVEIGGLNIRSGDLLHADRHGILSVPLAAAKKLPSLARKIQAGERRFIGMCMDGKFSIERLAATIRDHTERHKTP